LHRSFKVEIEFTLKQGFGKHNIVNGESSQKYINYLNNNFLQSLHNSLYYYYYYYVNSILIYEKFKMEKQHFKN